MGRPWKYKLKTGTALRKAVEDSDEFGFEGSALVLDRLEDCCREAMKLTEHEEDAHEHYGVYTKFEDLLGLIDGEAEVIRTKPEIIVSEWEFVGGVTQLVDERLAEFYDLCDEFRMWVEW